MQPSPHFGFQELYNHVVGDIAKALCVRNGESLGERDQRVQAAVHMVMGFLPRDVIEALLAGHCVIFHELMLDSVRHTLAGEPDTTRRGSRAGIVAMDRCFASNLRMLEHYQTRPAQWERDAPTAAAAADAAMTEPPDVRAAPAVPVEAPAQKAAAAANAMLAPAADASESEPAPGVPYYPSPRTVADILATPGALEALEAGDAAAFAQAMGVECPSEEFLAAAAQPGSPFDCSVYGGTSAPAVTREPVSGGSGRGQSAGDARERRIVPAGE